MVSWKQENIERQRNGEKEKDKMKRTKRTKRRGQKEQKEKNKKPCSRERVKELQGKR